MGFIEIIVMVLFGIFAYQKINDHEKIGQWSWWKVFSQLWIYAIYALVVYGLIIGLFVGVASTSGF